MNNVDEYIAGLRELADFLESHPDLVPRYTGLDVALIYHSADGDAVTWLAGIAKTLGRAQKAKVGTYYEVSRVFGPHKISANASEENVCERVLVGTKTIERDVPPPGVDLVRETVEQVYEWRCPPSLLAGAS